MVEMNIVLRNGEEDAEEGGTSGTGGTRASGRLGQLFRLGTPSQVTTTLFL